MRPHTLLAIAALLGACTHEQFVARHLPDVSPTASWSPTYRDVALAEGVGGAYAGRVSFRGRAFELSVLPSGTDALPHLVVRDCGDGTTGTLSGSRDRAHYEVDGTLQLRPDARSLAVDFSVEGDDGEVPTLTVLVTECPKFEVDLGGRTIRGLLLDCDSDGRFDDLDSTRIVFDRDGDGEHDDDDEGYGAAEAFDLGTGAFSVREISADGTSVTFESSWSSPAVRAFVGRGDMAPPLPAEAIDGGEPIDLSTLRGRQVILLFWFPT